MPHRTRGWVWAGRAAAVAAVTGLAIYLVVAGPAEEGRLAAPVGLGIAVAGLSGPYLLQAYQRPADSPEAAPTAASAGGVVAPDHPLSGL